MKTLWIICCLSLAMIWAGPVIATPFLICDPQAGVTEYQLTIDGTDKGMFPAETDGSAKIELSQFNLPDGEHTFILVASSAWGGIGTIGPLCKYQGDTDQTNKPGFIGVIQLLLLDN